VFVDTASYELVERSAVEGILRHHISNNLIHVGKSLYRQVVGISQGSVLSSLLCSLFYGHMEQHGLKVRISALSEFRALTTCRTCSMQGTSA
jgi:telomerase reverse transcriptase